MRDQERPTRREFLEVTTVLAGGVAGGLLVPPSVAGGSALFRETARGSLASSSWSAGEVHHLLPTVSHDRILLKASFRRPLVEPPSLRVNSRLASGRRRDTKGEFWEFDVAGLEPDRTYELQILDRRRRSLCDPWPLTTFPAPTERPQQFRLLVYTCAGGHDMGRDPETGQLLWVPVPLRRKLLQAGLSWRPNAAIAIGDHVYWDLRAGRGATWLGRSAGAISQVGEFARDVPVLGTRNEAILHLAVRPQIADLYGTLFRSTPCFFVQDDHDYFENDHATDEIVTFPPDPFMLRLARATQRMYYPEYLPDSNRPSGLPSAGEEDRAPGVSESFGTVRFGRLVEILTYDCRRYLTLAGPTATFVPETVESWLRARMAAQETEHVVNLPSTPPGWTAGKWAEWYPDVLGPGGKLTTEQRKQYWQAGWAAQHDRLLGAACAMRGIPLFLSGDLHALGVCGIHRTDQVDWRANPVVSVLTGPISTGPWAWPSTYRGTPPLVPNRLEVEERLAPVERNGFSIVDFTPGRILIRFFSWKLGEPEAALDAMTPFQSFEVERRE